MRRTLIAIAALSLAACGPASLRHRSTGSDGLTIAVLLPDNQPSAESLGPLLNDLQKQTGLAVKALPASDYAAVVKSMRSNEAQFGWLSASAAADAVDNANADILGRAIADDGGTSYSAVLIASRGSAVTLDDLLKCDRRLRVGLGDPGSITGDLAPEHYVFAPKGIVPARCFKSVQSASQEANLAAVANGVIDVATTDTVSLVAATHDPEGRRKVAKVKVIWASPPLPESAIVARRDLDPKVVSKIRAFFLDYGKAEGAEGDRQRRVMARLNYRGFAPTGDDYLDPVRAMIGEQALRQAEKSRDPRAIAAARKALAGVTARMIPEALPSSGAP